MTAFQKTKTNWDMPVWVACIKTPNGRLSPLVMSKNKKRVMERAKELAVLMSRTVYIKRQSELNEHIKEDYSVIEEGEARR